LCQIPLVVYKRLQISIFGGSRGSDHCACLTGSDVNRNHVTFPFTLFNRIIPYFIPRTFLIRTSFFFFSRTFFPVFFSPYFFSRTFFPCFFSPSFSPYFFFCTFFPRTFCLVVVQNVGWGFLYDVRVL
jgi:hypothetical protein